MPPKYKAPRGTQDVLPEVSWRWQRVETAFRDICRCYGYREIRTPIFEDTELFVRGTGEGTEIVNKQMYTFPDRGGRSLTLRPEGTPSSITWPGSRSSTTSRPSSATSAHRPVAIASTPSSA